MQILFEDKDFLVINKPAGLVVHSDGKTNEPSVVDWLMQNYPDIRGIGESLLVKIDGKEVEISKPGIVHRIDRETSGCLLIVKNQEAFEKAKAQFQERKINKKYHAFIYGWPREDFETIKTEIGRSNKDFRMWSAQRGARGKLREAITEYRVLSRFELDGERISLIELSPKTGRTHQLRVHMKYKSMPILCDSLYAPKRSCLLNFNRVALHAREICFSDMEDKEICVEAPYPPDFEKALEIAGIKLEI